MRRGGLAVSAAALVVVALVVLLLLLGARSSPASQPSQNLLGSGSDGNCPSPPQGFDALHASPTQIAYYGLPPRPSDPVARASWATAVAHAKHRVCDIAAPGVPVPANPTAQDREGAAWVAFGPGTTYATALREVTDLGLQLSGAFCPSGVVNGANWTRWTPIQYTAEEFAQLPDLTVQPTPLAPSDWLTRLQAASQVRMVRTNLITNCPAYGFETPAPGTLLILGPHALASYARLTFAPGVSYDAALQTISTLGLRLANPCYERAVAAGAPPPWQPAGQEAGFASSHTLLMAPGPAASTQWQAQGRAATGATAEDAPYVAACN